jgi:hypothetical protein
MNELSLSCTHLSKAKHEDRIPQHPFAENLVRGREQKKEARKTHVLSAVLLQSDPTNDFQKASDQHLVLAKGCPRVSGEVSKGGPDYWR